MLLLMHLQSHLMSQVGVHLFKGALWHCSDGSFRTQSECNGTYVLQTQTLARKWQQPPVNFNNILEALLALFQIATFDNWAVIMYQCIDSTGGLISSECFAQLFPSRH